jgi:hypothetical protein
MDSLKIQLEFIDHLMEKRNRLFNQLKWVTISAITLVFILMFGLVCMVKAETVNLSIIAKIESNNNPLAYNRHSGARGLYQITPICLKEYNVKHTASKIDSNALFSPVEARKVAEWYLLRRIPELLKFYGFPAKIDNILVCYNAGIGKLRKGIMPKETKNYIAKYYKLARSK